jgi:hypothetical protein
MPQRLISVCPEASITFSPDALADKPDLAILVSSIVSNWAHTEHELSMLMVLLVGPEEGPSLAVYDALEAASAKERAVTAAAKYVLVDEQFEIFSAVINDTNSIIKTRNKLVHWLIGSCPELPNAMLLGKPAMMRAMKTGLQKRHPKPLVGKIKPGYMPQPFIEEEWEAVKKAYEFDKSEILVFTKADLERAKRDAQEVNKMLFELSLFLRPMMDDWAAQMLSRGNSPNAPPQTGTSAGALLRLSKIPRFQAALQRVRRQNKNNPEAQDEEPC